MARPGFDPGETQILEIEGWLDKVPVDLAPGQEAPGLPDHDRPEADSKKDQRGDIDRGRKSSMERAKSVIHGFEFVLWCPLK